MKDLELTVFPRSAVLDAYKTVDGSMVWYTFVVDEIRDSKRLTNAELAAECYRQMTRAIRESGIAELPGDMIAPGDAVTFGPHRRETQRLGTLHRFATLPHYDEQDQQ